MDMKSEKPTKIGIACSIFREEIELLLEQKQIEIPFEYQGSMLHMYPDVLDRSLKKVMERARQNGEQILLVYGDCCPHMYDYQNHDGVERVRGRNCMEIILGRDQYRQLRSEGTFFLMPEWTHRWREVFQGQMGLEGDNARSFMTEFHTKLVYLDTGLSPIPEELLNEISEFCGLPVEIMPVSLNQLLASILEVEKRAQTDE